MATRGTVVVGGNRYIITHDAYPSHARRIIRMVLKTKPTTVRQFLSRCRKAGLALGGKAPKSFTYPFEEYRYVVNLKKGTVRTIKAPGEKQYLARLKKEDLRAYELAMKMRRRR